MLQPDAFCEHTMQQNSTAGWLRTGSPLRAHTAAPDNLVGFKGAASRRGGTGKEGEQKGTSEGGEGKGRLTLMQWRIQRGQEAIPLKLMTV